MGNSCGDGSQMIGLLCPCVLPCVCCYMVAHARKCDKFKAVLESKMPSGVRVELDTVQYSILSNLDEHGWLDSNGKPLMVTLGGRLGGPPAGCNLIFETASVMPWPPTTPAPVPHHMDNAAA